jgi:hypothetical protein
LTVLAFIWSLGLLVAALVVPVYGTATLVGENGEHVLLVAGAPVALCIVVWFALWRRCSRGGLISGYVAWAGVCVCGMLCVVGIFSIGIFVLPVTVLLALAASLTPSKGPPAPGGKALV